MPLFRFSSTPSSQAGPFNAGDSAMSGEAPLEGAFESMFGIH